MKKTMIVLLAGLAARTSPVSRQRNSTWRCLERVHALSTDEQLYYYDSTTLRRSGDVVKAWLLIDFAVAQTSKKGPYRSAKMVREFQCATGESKLPHMLMLADAMGQGTVVNSENDRSAEWIPVAPGSNGETILAKVCAAAPRKK